MPAVITKNNLINESSPYLLQHANNPVNWYPWGDEAFEKAKKENKPVFLSIGYSTCHWCHVMAHECFEDSEVAALLNRNFVCIKVDKEERPDIDNIYMSVCIALTGSGGWPLTVVMDNNGKPFFAGTYFPKRSRYGAPGLMAILEAIREKWKNGQAELIASADRILEHVNTADESRISDDDSEILVSRAVNLYKGSFDKTYGGFGQAPKFPSPHNLLFLMKDYEVTKDEECLQMVEKTMTGMAQGGIYDHIGFGFSRYSTDNKWLIPHFEKMLYDNAMLIMAYSKAYKTTGNALYKTVVENTIKYIDREMTGPDGEFFSAQDADSDGVEGKYYVFTQEEVISVLGSRDGKEFCRQYNITERGNFEGKNIPNRIGTGYEEPCYESLDKLFEHRKHRTTLHKDDKILTSWNALMIAALAEASTVFGCDEYLDSAVRAAEFIEKKLSMDGVLFASFRSGKRTSSGFIDDYAFYIYALIALYNATLDSVFLNSAESYMQTALRDFFDHENGGFYLYGTGGEQLVSRPKETFDGAVPSGNSVMAMNLTTLSFLTENADYTHASEKMEKFMNAQASGSNGAMSFYLYSLLCKDFPGRKITIVLRDKSEADKIKKRFRGSGLVRILTTETGGYKLLDGKTAYYVCENNVCHPPVSELCFD